MDKFFSKKILEEFLSFPLSSGTEVLNKFAVLDGAISSFNGDKRSFVYVPGTRSDRVLLVAHVDTVWDNYYVGMICEQEIKEENGVYSGINHKFGIGADDRAGCAMLWLLKESGHSLLVVDGEEHGQIGSHHLRMNYPELFDEINNHSYIIQFDRREADNYKVYNLPVSDSFIEFIEESTGYHDAGRNARTDIVVLCRDVCGVNLGIGYHNEHKENETLVFDEWFKTLELAEKMLSDKQNKYPMKSL